MVPALPPPEDPRTAFLRAATWHGDLTVAERLRAEHADVVGPDLHTAAVLGDAVTVRRLLAADPAAAGRKSPPYGGDALNYLALSKYLRLDPARTPAFLRAATALLDAGADPNTGFWTAPPHPEFETALYGAAGVAHHEGLTRLLLERGADPNDGEAVYHSPEGADLGALRALVETGRLTPANLCLMLLRKLNWHDLEGVRYLLARGADPGLPWRHAGSAVRHAITRDNSLAIIRLLLDHGADFTAPQDGATGVALAARRGRRDVLDELDRRGIPVRLDGLDRLLEACARGDVAGARRIAAGDPAVHRQLGADGPRAIAEFTGTWNLDGVRILLDLGVPVDARYAGDGYFDIAPESTALHVAAWKLRPELVDLLIGRGADVNARDGRGRTPLMLAVKGCVDSYWTGRRTPEPARLLLAAGARRDGVPQPTGYAELDRLL